MLTDDRDERPAAEAPALSSELSRRLLSTSDDCIKVLTLDGCLGYMNEGGLCAMEVDDFCLVEGAFWPQFWPGDGRDKALAAVRDAQLGKSTRFQSFCPTAKGTPKWWDVSVAPLLGADGTPEKILANSRDITELMSFKAALHESEENYRYAIELNPQISWTADAHGTMLHVSGRLAALISAGDEEVTGAQWLAAIHPADRSETAAAWARSIETGAPYDVRYRLRHRDGSYRWFRGRAAPRLHDQGTILRWYGISEDVHDLEVAQRDLLRVSRLNAMGAMASTLAHELNQPLAAAANFLAVASRSLESGRITDAGTAIDRAKAQALRAGRIIHHIRGFTDQGGVQRIPLTVSCLVDEALAAAHSSTQKLNLSLDLNYDPDAPMVLGDRLQIEQVLTNVFRNAIEAMEEVACPRLSVRTSCHLGGVEIIVRDNGVGLSREQHDKLFMPFARSEKPSSLGLGLSLCRTIVEAHGGSIWAEPPEEHGATFVIRLPASDKLRVAA